MVRADPVDERSFLRRFQLLALLLIACFLGAWAFAVEPASLRVRHYELALERWPHCQPLRVALLGDLHTGSPWHGRKQLAEIVRLTNEAAPDLVLLAGDFMIQGVLFGRLVPPDEIAEELGALETALGTYAVLGNHDHWHDAEEVTAAMLGAGIVVLEDTARRIEAPPGLDAFWLAGISDFMTAPHDVERALRGVPDGAPVLAFTHNPDLFPSVPERVALTMAAHTHGGQVRFPLLGTPVVPSIYGSRYVRGHVRERERDLFVTTGLGTSILPVRFRVPPEISLLKLRGAACPVQS